MFHFAEAWQNLFQNDVLLKLMTLKKITWHVRLNIWNWSWDEVRMWESLKKMNPFHLCEPNAFHHLGQVLCSEYLYIPLMILKSRPLWRWHQDVEPYGASRKEKKHFIMRMVFRKMSLKSFHTLLTDWLKSQREETQFTTRL